MLVRNFVYIYISIYMYIYISPSILKVGAHKAVNLGVSLVKNLYR